MINRKPRRAITLLETSVVIFVIGLLVALLLPAFLAARERAHSNECQGKIKQIGQALLEYEHVFGNFPLISSKGTFPDVAARVTAHPGSSIPGSTEAGYSWIVRILPYLARQDFYRYIAIKSKGLKTAAFDPSVVTSSSPGDKSSTRHPSRHNLSELLVCPSWGGDANTNGNRQIDTVGAASGAPEYASIGDVAPTNYKAIVGTHMVDGAPLENGAMLLTAKAGSTLESITDGLSRTIMVAETKECGYASWYDGTLNWLVTNDPNAKTPPGVDSGKETFPPWFHAQVAINVGPKPGQPTPIFYLPSFLTKSAPKNSVNWGPSSDHSNGAVMHVFADDHVQAITVDCDPGTYLNLTTRAGGEQGPRPPGVPDLIQ